MKAWAALVTFLCVNSRRLGKRSPQDVLAPPDGYLPSQEDEYQDDLAGYSANGSDLPAYSSAENEVPGLISLPHLVKSKRNATGEESYIDDIKSNNLDQQISSEIEETTTDSKTSYETTEFIEIEDDELIRYNAGADDLIESQVEPRIEFDQPMLSVETEKDETTTTQAEFDSTDNPTDDLEGSADSLQSDLKTGYGAAANENENNKNSLEKDYNATTTKNIENESGDPQLKSGDPELEFGDPQLESDDPQIESEKLRDDAPGVDSAQQEGDADTDHLEEAMENEYDETDKEKDQDENKSEAPMETTQIPEIVSEPKKETEKDDDQLTSSDENLKDILDNISNFSSLSTSIQTCPGGSITVCVSVCPGTSAKIYGACVQGCAERCEQQDPR